MRELLEAVASHEKLSRFPRLDPGHLLAVLEAHVAVTEKLMSTTSYEVQDIVSQDELDAMARSPGRQINVVREPDTAIKRGIYFRRAGSDDLHGPFLNPDALKVATKGIPSSDLTVIENP